MTTTAPDIWTKRCFITIQKKSGTAYEYAARTEDVDINEGSRGGNQVASVDGSMLWLDTPQEDGSITVKMRPIDLNTVQASGGLFQQYRGGTYDTTEAGGGLSTLRTTTDIQESYNRHLFMIAVLWTNDDAATAGSGAVAEGHQGLRFFAKNCRITEHSVSFANKELVVSATFKFPCRTAANVWNYDWQSCNSAALTEVTYA